METIKIFCDGGARNNGKENAIGGWGVYLTYQDYEKTLYGGDKNVTNNQMEIKAVIEGLKQLKINTIPIEVICDSAYVVNCINQKWYNKWILNNWRTSTKKPVENKDLWQELLNVISQFKHIQFFRITGHLSMNKMDQLENAHKKFVEENRTCLPMEEFIKYMQGNNLADLLVNKAMNKLEENYEY